MSSSSAFMAIFLYIILISFSESQVVKQEHSITGLADGTVLGYWKLIGSSELTPSYIRLTPDESSKRGAMWNNFACFARNWEIQLHFHIHGEGKTLYGDGLAIWYTKENEILGPVFGSKDYFSGLGVFLDTYENQHKRGVRHNHPYLSAMVNNGSLHYNHDVDGTSTQIGGCQMKARNMAYDTKLAISYLGNVLTVYSDTTDAEEWKECFKSHGVYLPTGYYFGLSASTGDLSDNHDIISMTVLELETTDLVHEDRQNIIPYAKFYENIKVPKGSRKKEHKVEKQENEEEKQIDETETQSDEREKQDKETVKDETMIKTEKHPKKVEKQTEGYAQSLPSSASLLTKVLYIMGTLIIIIIAWLLLKKYYTQRRERMHKRLF